MTVEYDNAWAKYQSKMKRIPTPLVCWDFYFSPISDLVLVNRLQKKWSKKIDFLNISEKENRQIIITNENFKIIFASSTIVDMNGYEPKEIIGKSPGMFQGKETAVETKKIIENALKDLKPFKEVILNHCCPIKIKKKLISLAYIVPTGHLHWRSLNFFLPIFSS